MGFSGGFAVTSSFGYRFVRRLCAQNMSTSDWLALKRLESLKSSVAIDSQVATGKVQMLISKKNYEALMYAIELQRQLDEAMRGDMKESASVEQLIPKAADYMAVMYAIEYGGAGVGLALEPGLKEAADYAVTRFTGGYEIASAASEAKLTLHVARAKTLSQRVLAHAHAHGASSAATVGSATVGSSD